MIDPEVIWVATLNEDYQPTPSVAYVGIGPRGVPRVLSKFRELIEERDRTGISTPSILLVIDPDLDTPDEIGSWQQGVKVDDVIDALKDLGTVYKRRDEALRVVEQAEGQLENAGRSIARALGEIKATATPGTNG